MRFERLDLKRFGCFTDQSLDLDAPGTHVIVGGNEAGKTTAMAAVQQLLFGIPLRSPHAFLHDLPDLCLGGLVSDEEGNTLDITRLKRRKDTLRGPSDEVIAESTLAKMCHDIDQSAYATLFAIGHEEIALGGAALLDSEGELGRALFSANRGTSQLNAILQKLEARASELFKKAGSKQEINAALRRYKDHEAAVKSLSSSATEAARLDTDLRQAQTEQATSVAARKEIAGTRASYERVRSARPQLVKREELLAQKKQAEQSGPVAEPELRPCLSEAQGDRDEAERASRTAQAAIERLDGRLDGYTVDAALLDQREAIDRVQEELGAYRQNRKDLPGLAAQAGSLGRDLEQLARRLPAGCTVHVNGQSTLTADHEERIRALAEGQPALLSRDDGVTSAIAETEEELEARRGELQRTAEPSDVDVLVTVLARIRKAGDLEALTAEKVSRLEAMDASLSNSIGVLGLSCSTPRDVDAIAVPSIETLRTLREASDERQRANAGLAEQIDILDERQQGLNKELEALLEGQSPPDVNDLPIARARRDEGWALVRSAWLTGSVDSDAVSSWTRGDTLETAYEAAVIDADDVADRLRGDAEAVERRAYLERELADTEAGLEAKRGERLALEADQREAEKAWQELWLPLGIKPDHHGAMETWHEDFRACSTQAQTARQLASEIAADEKSIARHRMDLLATMGSASRSLSDVSLMTLLDQGDLLVAEARAAEQARKALEEQVAQNEKRLTNQKKAQEAARAKVADWIDAWADAVSDLGLGPAATPAEANAILKVLDEGDRKTKEYATLERRKAGIEKRNQRFAADVDAVLAKLPHHADLVGFEPDIATQMLSRRLSEALDVATEHRTTTAERQGHIDAKAEADLQLSEAKRRIQAMAEAAGLADEADLAEAIARGELLSDLVDQITQIEEGIRESTGLAISIMQAHADALDGVELEPEIAELDRQLEELDPLIHSQSQLVGELTTKRSMLDASGKAAEAAELAQQALAEVEQHADEYVRTLLARQLLEEQIDVYRSEREEPLLGRARDLFRQLTLNRYHSVDTDTDDKGTAHLLAITAGGKSLTVDALSSGTRDQLFLSLRIAALEQFIERRGSLPLLLDDLFVHFDDERTAAGLAVLDDVANDAQVLLFTHHEQVAVQAAEVLASERVTIHRMT